MKSFPLLVRVLVCFPLMFWISSTSAANLPLGILTMADHAHLDEGEAFVGLSVFEGERLSTDAEGRLGIRAGHSTLALGAKAEAVLFKVSDGVHVDMSAGSLYFATASDERMEIHIGGATLQPDGEHLTRALVTILAPNVIQVSARQGGLSFSYRQEFRNLPEGETYRIYLDAPGEPQDAAGAGAQGVGVSHKVMYFIVGAGVTGITAWGIHAATASGNGPESPAKP